MATSVPPSRVFPGLTIEVNQPTTETQGGRDPDPNWQHVDTAGHLHAWVDGKLPTLKKIVDEPAAEGYDWYSPERSHYECRSCRKMRGPRRPNTEDRTVIPGYKGVGPKTIPSGPAIITAEVISDTDGTLVTRIVRLTDQQYTEVLDAPRAAVARMADDDPTMVLNTEMRVGA